jgi:hypothetical protein
MRKRFAAVLLILAVALCAAQDEKKNELAVTVGRTFISDQTVSAPVNILRSGKGLSFIFNYARVLRTYKWGSLSAEVPVTWNPDEDLHYPVNVVPVQYVSIALTPGARVRFLEDYAFHPWVSFGGGVARYTASRQLMFFGTNTGHRIKTTGALDGAVGLDIPLTRKLNNLMFRFEARDVWTGVPPVNVDTGKTHQHNIFVGGGVLLTF